ncbi:MAG: cytidylate kinase-like family protein [Lachnospiraceae bacterium]|nr:cytidylate kinase-like family protein [Lachnospiraceae bacterium]
MDKQIIITVGREFGSGGIFVAEAIAKDLNIPLYDKNILEEICAKKGTPHEFLASYNEKPRNRILSRTVRGETNSPEFHLAQMQFEFLRNKAAQGESFVVLGRCSEEILKGTPGLINLFILADPEWKQKRVMENFNLSADDALAKMKKMDKQRKHYHNSHSQNKWGDSRTYDLCINSSRLGVEGTVKEVLHYVHTRIDAL